MRLNNDLISKKNLISHIEREYRQWGEDYDAGQIQCDLEMFPVAYDIDKVILKITELQLKIKEKLISSNGEEEFKIMLRGQLRGIADCLEIVKSGGNCK